MEDSCTVGVSLRETMTVEEGMAQKKEGAIGVRRRLWVINI